MKRKIKRARDRRGRYLGDNPKTLNRNEAYEEIVPTLKSYKDTLNKHWSLW